MPRLIISLFFLSLFLGLSSQNIDFYDESLTFRLQPGSFELDGLYYLRNNTDAEIRQALFFPYPDPERYGEISFIKATREGDTASILARERRNGAVLDVTLQAHEEAAFHIRYVQNLIGNEAKYIILTTRYWGKPFEHADYRLEVPDSLLLRSISIEPDTIFSTNGKRIYLWEKEDFMPEVDFEFEFE